MHRIGSATRSDIRRGCAHVGTSRRRSARRELFRVLGAGAELVTIARESVTTGDVASVRSAVGAALAQATANKRPHLSRLNTASRKPSMRFEDNGAAIECLLGPNVLDGETHAAVLIVMHTDKATAGMALEKGTPNYYTTNGFDVIATLVAGAQEWTVGIGGTLGAQAGFELGQSPAGASSVSIVAKYDRATAVPAAEIAIYDGGLLATATTDDVSDVTGAFGSGVLNVGARANGASVTFDGDIWLIAIAAGDLSADKCALLSRIGLAWAPLA